ncbi:GIY-YIG nuclease family protein [Dialister sp.]|uniref:GIY-YIG nuclease family protein n=1 Tax=Dialister sp. TaxID=1955814 RepID=UPI003EFD251B
MSGSEERQYFTYMVRCADGTLYTGFTVDDLEKRIRTHNSGKGARYTRSRLPVELVWYRRFSTEHEARSLEWHMKRKTRKEKEALAASFGKDKEQ